MSDEKRLGYRFLISSAIALLVVGAPGCISTPEHPGEIFVGTWEVEVDSQSGPIEQTWEVEQDLMGVITHPRDGSTMDMFNVHVRRSRVKFDVVFDIEGRSVPAKFEGTISDDTILGVYVTEFGDGYVRGLHR